MCHGYYLPFTAVLFWLLAAVIAAVAGGSVEIMAGAKEGGSENTSAPHSYLYDVVHEQRIRFATEHGVANPAALVAAVRRSHMADLLISVAIEESHGDPLAVGLAGEEGAWQVIASNWGSVPEDIQGQAGQAERIIRGLLISAKGDIKEALARYNGGTAAPGKSYRYAERILKRAGQLQFAINFLPLKGTLSWQI